MENFWTRRLFWIHCMLATFVLFRYSSPVQASVPKKNADYSMFDFQFNRVGDTKLDNEVTDCALVKHQYQKGYIRLREYLERMEGCGRKGKTNNIEGIAESTVEDLRREMISEIAKATTEDLSVDSQSTAAPKPAASVLVPAPPVVKMETTQSANQVIDQKIAQQLARTSHTQMQQAGVQRSHAARPVIMPQQQGEARGLVTPYDKAAGVAQFPSQRAGYNSLQRTNKFAQVARAFSAPNPVPRPVSHVQRFPQSTPANAQALYKSRLNAHPGLSVTVGKPLFKPAPAFNRFPANPNQNAQRAKPASQLIGSPKRQPGNVLFNTHDEDDTGTIDEALDDTNDVHNPDKDIDDAKVDDAIDKEPNDMPMPGVNEDATDEGIQAAVTGGSNRGGLGPANQKNTGIKAGANIQTANQIIHANSNPNAPFQVGHIGVQAPVNPNAGLNAQAYRNGRINAAVLANHGNPQANRVGQLRGVLSAQFKPNAGLNAQAYRNGRINAAVLANHRNAQANRVGRLGGVLSAQFNHNNGAAKLQASQRASLRSGPATNQQMPNQMSAAPNGLTETNADAINLDVLKNKIMHTTNATYLRHMLQLIRQITHHRDFQKLHGPARAFVNQANTAVQVLNKAYSQRITRPVMNQSYQQPQHPNQVVKKFQIARNPHYAQSYYRAPYHPPYYALQRMQYGWYNGNTP